MALDFIGLNYKSQGDLDKALEYAKEADKYKTDDPRNTVLCPWNYGDIYYKKNNLDSALKYARLSFVKQSLVPQFAQDGAVTRDTIWWLHENNRALRRGNWKIVAAGRDSPWELYDLSSDRAESNNLAAKQPERVRELADLWRRQTEQYSELAGRRSPAGP